jgi:ribonuclease D
LLGNKVPAAILDPPYTTMAAKEGYKLLVDPAPMDVPYLRNIVAALAEGMQFNRNKSNKEESIKILAKYLRMPLEKNRAMIEEGYETYRQMMLKKPYADPSAMKILTAMIAEATPKARNIDLASGSIEQLKREGAFDR